MSREDLPKTADIERPLLMELQRHGGSARPRDVYRPLAKHFNLTEEQRTRRDRKHPSTVLWWNQVQWARQELVKKGELDPSVRGFWKITPAGIERIKQELVGSGEPRDSEVFRVPTTEKETTPVSLSDLVHRNEAEVRKRLLSELMKLKPVEFEHFTKRLLQALGFEDVEVTQQSRDGGIDGYGQLQIGVLKVRAAFQCKRWENPVPKPKIVEFIGSLVAGKAQYEHGIFITTSSFTKDALEQAKSRRGVPVVLMDGERVIDLMIQHRIGIRKRPIEIIEITDDFFEFPEARDEMTS